MRYLIKFTKGSEIKFISHLDMLRTIQRIVAKTELDVSYSKGYNPHMATFIGQPLSVGVYSEGEYMDLDLDNEVSTEYVLDELNRCAPPSIRFLNAVIVPAPKPNEKKTPPCMALIDAADYTIIIRYFDDNKNIEDFKNSISSEVESLKNLEEWNMVKRTKKGEKEVDIKPLVKEFNFNLEDGENGEVKLIIKTLLSCGSRGNLSADLLANFIKDKTNGYKEGTFVNIKREEMYTLLNDKLVPLSECIEKEK